MNDKPDQSARDEWYNLMIAHGWHEVRDLYGAITEWRWEQDGRVSIVPAATAELYIGRGNTPSPF